MTGQSDDKKSETGAGRNASGVGAAHDASDNDAAKSVDVTADVARVVDLLQRLDKLHSKPMPGAGGETAALLTPVANSIRPAGTDGLSSLQAVRDRGAGRPAAAGPVPYLVPPAPPAVQPQAETVAVPVPGTAPGKNDFPTLTIKAGAKSKLAAPVKSTDRAPVALIGSVIAVMAGLGAWGLFNLQPHGVPSDPVGLPAGRAPPVPTQARLDAVTLIAKPKATKPDGIAVPGCGIVAVQADAGALSLSVYDPERAGQAVTVAVDGLEFKAAFEPLGQLRLRAPLLSQSATVRWPGTSGISCEQTAKQPDVRAALRIALAWTGAAGLDLHAVEPNSWLGGPLGHISNLAPNTELDHGAGFIEAFGSAEGTRVLVYAVDPGRIPVGGIISAFVKPAGSGACAERDETAEPSRVQYQVQIIRAAPGQPWQRDVQSFAMQVPACGNEEAASSAGERIMVRN